MNSEIVPHDVFLSYSRHDHERARAVFDALGKQAGWLVFMDEQMPNATRWEDYIRRNLEAAHCVLVLWSEAANVSTWVKEETKLAIKRGALATRD